MPVKPPESYINYFDTLTVGQLPFSEPETRRRRGGPKPLSAVERVNRFWRYVNKEAGPEGCWPWTGYRAPNGYGQFATGRRHRGYSVPSYAHRLSWEMARGPVPAGFEILHSCDTKACCNPAHMRLGTRLENAREAVARGLYQVPRPRRTALHKALFEQVLTGPRGTAAHLCRAHGLNYHSFMTMFYGWRARQRKAQAA